MAFVVYSRHYGTSFLLQSNDAISVLTIHKKSVYTMKNDEYKSEEIKSTSMLKATKTMKSNTIKMSPMH